MSNERKPGWYWTLKDSEWSPSEWTGLFWWDCYRYYRNNEYFEEIDERPIVREEKDTIPKVDPSRLRKLTDNR
jgi:hypothetical protein